MHTAQNREHPAEAWGASAPSAIAAQAVLTVLPIRTKRTAVSGAKPLGCAGFENETHGFAQC